MSLPLRSGAPLLRTLTRPLARPSCLTASLLQLPAETRASLFRSRVAQFHASSRLHDTAANAPGTAETIAQASTDHLIQTAPSSLEAIIHALLTHLHTTTGLSWALTIPLSAILIRAILIPWQIADRRGQQRFFDLQPLLNAWKVKLQNSIHFQHAHRQDGDWMRREHLKAFRTKTMELLQRWQCGQWQRGSLIYIQLPIFLGVSSVYRRMSGKENGFLSWVIAWLPGAPGNATGSSGSTPVSMTDMSFATEGMLWFPDLMQPDLTLGLGIITAGMNVSLMLWTTYKSSRTAAAGVRMSRWRRIILNGGIILSVAIIPASTSMPAGAMLYWASSTAATAACNTLLDVYMPLRIAPTPCKRKAKVSFQMTKPS